jgi:hypothetical protein
LLKNSPQQQNVIELNCAGGEGIEQLATPGSSTWRFGLGCASSDNNQDQVALTPKMLLWAGNFIRLSKVNLDGLFHCLR